MSQINQSSDREIQIQDKQEDSAIQKVPLIAQQNDGQIIRNENLQNQEEEKSQNQLIVDQNPEGLNLLKDLKIEPKFTLKQKFLPDSFFDDDEDQNPNRLIIDDLTKDHSTIQNYLEFEKDFEKLNQHIIQTHPFKQENGKFKKYSVCDDIGSYSCPCSSKKPRVSSLSKEIGIGSSMFLLTLKQLILFFLCMTVLNIPLYCILYGKNEIQKQTFLDYLAQLSIGSLDQNSLTCSQQNIAIDMIQTIQCPSPSQRLNNLQLVAISNSSSLTCPNIVKNSNFENLKSQFLGQCYFTKYYDFSNDNQTAPWNINQLFIQKCQDFESNQPNIEKITLRFQQRDKHHNL